MQATTDATAAVPRRSTPTPPRLVRDTMELGFRYPIELRRSSGCYRFPVLAHWSFTTNEGATFETLMQDLDVGLLGTLPAPPVPEPARPATAGAAAVDRDRHRPRRPRPSHPPRRHQPGVVPGAVRAAS